MHFINFQEEHAYKMLALTGALRAGWYPTFTEFIANMPDAFKQAFDTNSISITDRTAAGQLLHATCIVHNAGAPLFKLEPDLAALLKETDLPNDISIELLRLPFEGIRVEFPKNTLSAPLNNAQHMLLTCAPNDRFRIVCLPDSETVHHISLHRPDINMSIHEAVLYSKTHAFAGIPESVVTKLKNSWAFDDYYCCDMFSFAVNTALYLTSVGADFIEDKSKVHALHAQLQGLKKKNRREDLERKIREEKTHKIYICGSKLQQQPEMAATFTEEGRRVTKRFRVRGHWRNQACGTGRLDRRHLFIQPHWRGPTFAELLARNYIVKGH